MENNIISVDDLLTKNGFKKDESGIYKSGNEGYWSNLDKEKNKKFIELLKNKSPLEAVRKIIPELEDHIYSVNREVALELLDIKKDDICIDYGCMWGVLSVGMAKRGGRVISVDQTEDSLAFLNSRKIFDGYKNITCVQDDIRKITLEDTSNVAIVNGVLEWVPEFGDIELKSYFGKKNEKVYPKISPEKIQTNFLRKVYANLKNDGELLLAIENRYDYKQFIGGKDPHVNLYFTSFLPRWMSSLISKWKLKRPYVNYLYSFSKLKKILLSVGFTKVDLYMVYPHYHAPLFILPYESGLSLRKEFWKEKNASWRLKLLLTFKWFSPSIIAIAKK